MTTSDNPPGDLAGPAQAWVGTFIEVQGLKARKADAEICARIEGLIGQIDVSAQDYSDPLIPLLETLASEGFAAAYRLERFDVAARCARVADEVASRIPDYEYGRARTLNNLALSLMERSVFAEAQELLDKAMTLLDGRADIRDLRATIASHMHVLAEMRAQSTPNKTAPRRRVSAPVPIQGIDHIAVRSNDALAAARQGDHARAMAEFEAILLQAHDLDPKATATILSNLGSSQMESGDLIAARRTLERAEQVCESSGYRGQVLAGILHELGELHLRAGGAGAKDRSLESFKRAWDIIRQVAPLSRQALSILRGLGLERMARGDHQRAQACFDRGIETYDQMRAGVGHTELEHEGLFEVYRRLVESRIWLAVHQGRAEAAFGFIQQAKARFLRERMRRRVPAESQIPDAEPESADASSLVGLNGMLVEFFVGPNATFVCVAHNRSLGAYRVDHTESKLSSMVEALRKRFEVGLRAVDAAQALSSALFDKLHVEWRDIRVILIAPDGPLWRIPLGALSVATASGRVELEELAPVATIPSAATLSGLQRGEGRRERSMNLLAVVNARPATAPPLRYAVREVETIKGLLPQDAVVDVLGAEFGTPATPDVVRSRWSRATHVHIAAHAFASGSDDDPFLLLADGQGGDTKLHGSEIEQAELTADLVFLAACDSSLGRKSAGEGLASLARSFLSAGAGCIVASLWALDDQRSAAFCRHFYSLLPEQPSTLRAFWLAKAAYAREFGRDQNWSGLTIIGNSDSWEDRYAMSHLG